MDAIEVPVQSTLYTNIPVYRQKPYKTCLINISSQIHGRVRLYIHHFMDQDLKNALSIKTDTPITKNNAYGALVCYTNLKYLKLKKLSSIPDLKKNKWTNAMSKFTYLQHKTGIFGINLINNHHKK